jgi:hypothetical protein
VEKLVERERELAAIDALLERGGGDLVVEGRAGIGKTSGTQRSVAMRR